MLNRLPRLAHLRSYFSKPQGRAAAHPHYLEIIVARTGHTAHTFRINLDRAKKIAAGLGIAAFVWFAGTFYVAYSHVANMDAIASAKQQTEKIALLKQRNEQLAEEKQQMGKSLFNLQYRVEQLAARVHGIVNQATQRFPAERQITQTNQGGVTIPVTASNADEIMRAEFGTLDARLANLLPKLESALSREVARPVGSPVSGSMEISSDYGLRANPFGRGHEFHNGIDFAVDVGTPVLATGPGTVDEAAYDGAYGYKVSIDHGYGYRSVYAHLSKLKVRTGAAVTRGQIVGLSGNTGRSSGPHLHYTLYYRGRTIDPELYLKAH